MTGFVVEYLAQNGRLAIIEDHDSTPDDPWLTNDPDRPALPPRLGFRDHLYWYASEPNPILISDLMRWGSGLFRCMALTRPKGQWPPEEAVAAVDLRDLAAAADHIVVDAFDFEGFAVWSSRR
jgi:hypothetical protein